jgi:hypothetical protein
MPIRSDLNRLQASCHSSILCWSESAVDSEGYLHGPGECASEDGYPMPYPGKILLLATYTTGGGPLFSTAVPIAFKAGDRIALKSLPVSTDINLIVVLNGQVTSMTTLENKEGDVHASVAIVYSFEAQS